MFSAFSPKPELGVEKVKSLVKLRVNENKSVGVYFITH